MCDVMKIDVIFEKQIEGGYTVYVPQLPGCISQGDTKEEAMQNITEAIDLYINEIDKEKLKELLSSVYLEQTEVPINVWIKEYICKGYTFCIK